MGRASRLQIARRAAQVRRKAQEIPGVAIARPDFRSINSTYRQAERLQLRCSCAHSPSPAIYRSRTIEDAFTIPAAERGQYTAQTCAAPDVTAVAQLF